MAGAAFLGDLILSAITGAGIGLTKSLIGGDQPACGFAPYGGDSRGYWQRAYTEDEDGNQKAIADICWTEGGYTNGPQDNYVAECLTQLHVDQAFTCITRVGSVCDGPESANTAIATMRVIYGASGNPNQQIDEYNYNKIMSTFEKVMADNSWDIGTQIHVAPRYDEGDITYWNAIFYGTGSPDNGC